MLEFVFDPLLHEKPVSDMYFLKSSQGIIPVYHPRSERLYVDFTDVVGFSFNVNEYAKALSEDICHTYNPSVEQFVPLMNRELYLMVSRIRELTR